VSAARVDSLFAFRSTKRMTEYGELRFKIVRVEMAGDEVLGRLSNLVAARAAFDVSVSLWPSAWIELRQDARIIEKHGACE
jgi:hypothetical protein